MTLNEKNELRQRFSGYNWLIIAILIFAFTESIGRLNSTFYATAGYTLVALSSCIAVTHIISASNPVTSILSLPLMQIIGRLSYSLYLWHPSALGLAGRVANKLPMAFKSPGKAIAYVLISFVLSTISYLLIERTFLKLKDKFSFVRVGNGA